MMSVSPRRPTAADQAEALLRRGPSRTAVLMDVGAVFFAVRDLYDGLQLNYDALAAQLCSRFPPLTPPTRGEDKWVMWTSMVAHNPGQVRFLQFAERELGWAVRRYSPSDGFLVDPVATLGLAADSRAKDRLLRYDASIAFAMGRLAVDHRIIVISDSFALAEPLARAARTAKSRNAVAFFGRLLDSRWQRVFQSHEVDFLDLSSLEEDIFGSKRTVDQNAWDDGFLTK